MKAKILFLDQHRMVVVDETPNKYGFYDWHIAEGSTQIVTGAVGHPAHVRCYKVIANYEGLPILITPKAEVLAMWEEARIESLGKKEVAYDRQLAVLGKKDADMVLYFWTEGYNANPAKHTTQQLREAMFWTCQMAIGCRDSGLNEFEMSTNIENRIESLTTPQSLSCEVEIVNNEAKITAVYL